MALLPKHVMLRERGLMLAQQKIGEALSKGQKQVTLKQEGVQFCQEVEVRIKQQLPFATVTGDVNKLIVKF